MISDRPPFLVFCPETLSITFHFLTRSSVKNCTGVSSEVKDSYCGVQINFNGMTPLGTNLNQKIIQPFLMGGINNRNLQKPILVIIITDGEPTGEPQSTVAQVIKNAKNMSMNSPYGPGAIAFEFAQVGKDQAAQAFLGQLDRDPGMLSCRVITLPALIAVLAVYRPCLMPIPQHRNCLLRLVNKPCSVVCLTWLLLCYHSLRLIHALAEVTHLILP